MPRTRTRNTETSATSTAARTHGGALAATLTPEQELRRTVLANLLFQNAFYENGQDTAARLAALVPQVDPQTVAQIAIEARERMYLRHVPLQLIVEMSKHATHKPLVASTLERCIQRADELTEFVALYWAGRERRGNRMPPLSNQVKKGLAAAFAKFNAYNLAKYNRQGPVKLKDVLFLTHPKPQIPRPSDDDAAAFAQQRTKIDAVSRPGYGRGEVWRDTVGQALTWRQLVEGTLPTPDTWETQLSAGANKRATFERLIGENKLGVLALIRNLRGMTEAGVPVATIAAALANAEIKGVLPHQIYSAYLEAPQFKDALADLLLKSARLLPRLTGQTALIIDESGSMSARLSQRGERTRTDAAASLAAIMAEICEDGHVYATADRTARVTGRGMDLAHNLARANVGGGGIYTARALRAVHADLPSLDRVIVITDGQDCEHDGRGVPDICELQYTVNVASYKTGITYGAAWVQIDGWSDHVVRYIAELEAAFAAQLA